MEISLNYAAKLLLSGQVVAVPTETVYGLAASIEHPAAIEKIFSLKGRPANNPLIVHLSHRDQLNRYVSNFPAGFKELVQSFWPGPLTLVLKVDAGDISHRVRAGLSTVAFRIPMHPLARRLIEQTGPLVMPSANLSGKPSATRREHVENDFGRDFPILEGDGACLHGVESTILVFKDDLWQIVRLGALTAEVLSFALSYTPPILIKSEKGEAPICPGQLHRHYAPKTRLILSHHPELYCGVVVGFLDRVYPNATKVIFLGSSTSPEQVAETLYQVLRQLDEEKLEEVCVDRNFPDKGLWATIAERIDKAST